MELGVRLLQAYTRQRPADVECQLLLIQALKDSGRSADEMQDVLERALKHLPESRQAPFWVALAETYLTRLRLRPTSCMGIRGGVCGLRSSLQGLPWL